MLAANKVSTPDGQFHEQDDVLLRSLSQKALPSMEKCRLFIRLRSLLQGTQELNSEREASVSWSVIQLDIPPNQTSVKVVPEVRTTPDGLRLSWGNTLTVPGPYAAQQNDLTIATFGLNPRASESKLASWLPDEWTQELISFGWKNIPVWTQPSEQLAKMVERHIAGERLAWYFFLAAMLGLALETLLLKRWNNLFS